MCVTSLMEIRVTLSKFRSGVVDSGADSVVLVGGANIVKIAQLCRGQRGVRHRINLGYSHRKVPEVQTHLKWRNQS